MKVEFDESFEKSIKKLKDPKIKAKLIDLIELLEEVNTVQTIPKPRSWPLFLYLKPFFE